MAGAHGSVFGRSTTAPPGMEGLPNPNGDPNEGAKFSTGEQGDNVPEFEGAESGEVGESTPIEDSEESKETSEDSEDSEEFTEEGEESEEYTEESEEGEESTGIDPIRLAVREEMLAQREAQLIAREAQLANQPPAQEEEDETSILDDIDEETLESDGELQLLGIVKKLEQEVKDSKKAANEATLASERSRMDTNINRVISEYGVTEQELEDKFAVTGVRDLDTLAQSILWEKGGAEESRSKAQQGQQARTKKTTKQAASSKAGASKSSTKLSPPTGRGVKNPFDGAEVAQKYSAFEK